MRAALLCAALLLPVGPAFAQGQSCPFAGQAPVLVVQVFFGGSIPPGPGRDSMVSHRAWSRFVADTIVPALPDGFTLTSAAGHYRDGTSRQTLPEATEVLLVAAPDSPAFRERVAAVVDAYRRRFLQRSVGIVSTGGCAAF